VPDTHLGTLPFALRCPSKSRAVPNCFCHATHLKMLSYSLAFAFFIFLTSASLHPAKRQLNLSFQDVCGANGIDCGNGYCCSAGQQCITSNPPLCRDLLLRDWTVPAVDYSSLINLVELNDLTTLGLTLSTIPRTLTFSTTLPTYTENVMPPQYTPPTFRDDLVGATKTAGGAPMPTVYRGVMLGGLVGAGLALA
jgi:hypothetical protein